MLTNKHHWNNLKTPPPSALKTIGAGRLKGMTDINPQWRLEAMTEEYGPVGVGWKYNIVRTWTEAVALEEVLAFVEVSVSIRSGDAWSEPVPGIGGNKLVAAESRGLHNNDEAFKMALTDALSVAFKAFGVAADIYSGLWDGSKYHKRPEDAISQGQLDSLKVKWATVFADSLEGLDRVAQLEKFNGWCRAQIGEMVHYNDASAWGVDWYETCWNKLIEMSTPSDISPDVPFESE